MQRLPGRVQGKPAYCLHGVRYTGGMNLIQAHLKNRRSPAVMVRERHNLGETGEADNTEALLDGGLIRSSEEALVMRVERRGQVVPVEIYHQPSLNEQGMKDKRETKYQPITRRQVRRAYQAIKDNGESAGIDGMSLKAFDEEKEANLYKIWNRMASGSYFPPAVREKEIPKEGGGTRILGIPTVSDRIAQMVVKHYIEPRLERIFHEDSYGYRPKKRMHEAIEVVRKRCIEYAWVIDLDIKGFFDNMDHGLLMLCLEKHFKEKWVLMYIERWLKASIQRENGEIEERCKGTPQGGVISPLLANLFLHYVFDRWMEIYHPGVKFERYADDIIVHCRGKVEAEKLLSKIRCRMESCNLELHPEKTKIVYCKQWNRGGDHEDVSFTFLGHTFKPRKLKSKYNGFFLGYTPAISREVIKRKVREVKDVMNRHKWVSSIDDLAVILNEKTRGWIRYYGRANKWAMKPIFDSLNYRLAKWLRDRFKRFKGSLSKAFIFLRQLSRRRPDLFVHWKFGFCV